MRPQFLSGDQTIAVSVEHFESMRCIFIRIDALLQHHLNELIKVYGTCCSIVKSWWVFLQIPWPKHFTKHCPRHWNIFPYWAVHSYCTIGVFVHISDHVLQILFWRIKAMSSHNLKILNFKNVLDALNIENNTKIQIPVFLFFSVYCVDCWLSVPSLIRWSYQGRWTVHYIYHFYFLFFKVKYGILHYLVLL